MAVAALPTPEPDDEVVEIDANSLTIGELEQIEEITGRNVSHELGRGEPSAKTLLALVYVFKKRTDPTISLDDVRKLNMRQFNAKAETSPKDVAG